MQVQKSSYDSNTETELPSDIFQCIEIIYVLVLQRSLLILVGLTKTDDFLQSFPTFTNILNCFLMRVSYSFFELIISYFKMSFAYSSNSKFNNIQKRRIAQKDGGGTQQYSGHNLPPLVRIGLTNIPKLGGHMPPRPPHLRRLCDVLVIFEKLDVGCFYHFG